MAGSGVFPLSVGSSGSLCANSRIQPSRASHHPSAVLVGLEPYLEKKW
jgi:hypothetical protein